MTTMLQAMLKNAVHSRGQRTGVSLHYSDQNIGARRPHNQMQDGCPQDTYEGP